MITPIGSYLEKLKSNKARIYRAIGMTKDRMNDICKKAETTAYGDELYNIIYIANHQAKLKEEDFNKAIDEIFPDRIRVTLLDETDKMSPIAKFYAKYTQKQNDIEQKLGLAKSKISKYFIDPSIRGTGIEIIDFADGMNMDALSTFKEIYGEIEIDPNT